MAKFLNTYVRLPLDDLLNSVSNDLPDLSLSMRADMVVFGIGDNEHFVARQELKDESADEREP